MRCAPARTPRQPGGSACLTCAANRTAAAAAAAAALYACRWTSGGWGARCSRCWPARLLSRCLSRRACAARARARAHARAGSPPFKARASNRRLQAQVRERNRRGSRSAHPLAARRRGQHGWLWQETAAPAPTMHPGKLGRRCRAMSAQSKGAAARKGAKLRARMRAGPGSARLLVRPHHPPQLQRRPGARTDSDGRVSELGQLRSNSTAKLEEGRRGGRGRGTRPPPSRGDWSALASARVRARAAGVSSARGRGNSWVLAVSVECIPHTHPHPLPPCSDGSS